MFFLFQVCLDKWDKKEKKAHQDPLGRREILVHLVLMVQKVSKGVLDWPEGLGNQASLEELALMVLGQEGQALYSQSNAIKHLFKY